MSLTFTQTRYETIERDVRVSRLHFRYQVVKVRRSKSGFRTSTNTVRSCERCRVEQRGVTGREPFPVATWLLTGVVRWGTIGGMEDLYATTSLCDDHFRETRQTRQILGELEEAVLNLAGPRA